MEQPVKSDRRRFRYVAKPRPFVAMKGSGGILRDVSHDGLALDVVGPSLTTKRVHLNFDISETGEHFEGLGEIIWKNESGSRIGVRFVDLPDSSRRTMQNWLSTKSNAGLSFRTADTQGCEKALNFETPLWMRPRSEITEPSIVDEPPEITESLIPASDNGGTESASKTGWSTRHTGVMPSDFGDSEWLRPEISTTSAVVESPKEVQPAVLSGNSILTRETEIERPSTPTAAPVGPANFETASYREPVVERAATSQVLESPENRVPSSLAPGNMSVPKEAFKSLSSARANISVPNFDSRIRLRPTTSPILESPEKVAASAAGNTSIRETTFHAVSSQHDDDVGVAQFETQAWLRPREHASRTSAVPKPAEKSQPVATVASYSCESAAESSELPGVAQPNEVEERIYTDVRASFKKALAAAPKVDREFDSTRVAYAWQYLFRWVLAGSFVCFGIVAVALGIRLSKEDLVTSTTYQTVRTFFLDTFGLSNPAPLVVHHAPPSASTHPLHLDKDSKTSRVRVSGTAPVNKPIANNQYEILDAKTGRRYFPHTGTRVAVTFEREQASTTDNVVVSGPGLRAYALKPFSVSQADANGGKMGRVLQKSTGELPVKEVIPEYPTLALQRNIQGRVTLSAIITTDGSLRNIRIIGSPSILDNAALSAVREWRYEAHHENGRPVEVETQIVVEFSISMER